MSTDEPSPTTLLEQGVDQTPATSDAAMTLGSVNRRRTDPLHKVELEVEVVLGRKKMLFRDVRELRVGAPIELERGRNEPVDVLVNGSPFAKGEIVVIGDQNLGVRITEIFPAESEGF